MSTTETKTASGVILAPDLATRYKLAEAQLALIPPIDEDDAEEWAGLRQHCEEVMALIERTSAAEKRERGLREALEKVCPMVYATRGEQLRLGLITNEQYRDMVRLRHSGIGAVETVCSALATPAPEQPVKRYRLNSGPCAAMVVDCDCRICRPELEDRPSPCQCALCLAPRAPQQPSEQKAGQ